LHGAGESGDQLELVKTHGLPKIVQEKTDFPAIVVSPQCPSAKEGWNRFLLRDLLKELTGSLNVDEDRVYITGLSMGGRGTWDMLAYYPEIFAAAVPVCGWGDTFLIRRAANVPVWAFHGARDRVVPVIRSVEMTEALQREKGNVRLTVYSEAEHDSWTETYNNPALYEWLFSQVRVKP
jgi:predicted peptidase